MFIHLTHYCRMNSRSVSIFRILAIVMVMAVGAVATSSCGDDNAQEITLSPFNGLWSLREINNAVVSDQLMLDRYMFMTDPADPKSDAGIGYYYYHDSTDPQQWQKADIKWELQSTKALLITGKRGGGTFEWMVRQASGYTELRLYDAQTQTERVYIR